MLLPSKFSVVIFLVNKLLNSLSRIVILLD
jgi:hypothetical protein